MNLEKLLNVGRTLMSPWKMANNLAEQVTSYNRPSSTVTRRAFLGLLGGLVLVVSGANCGGGGGGGGGTPPSITNPTPGIASKVEDAVVGVENGDFVSLYRTYSVNASNSTGIDEMDAIRQELNGLTVTGYKTSPSNLVLRLEGQPFPNATDSDNNSTVDVAVTIDSTNTKAVTNFSAFHDFAAKTASQYDTNKLIDDYVAANNSSIAEYKKDQKVYGILNGIRPNYYIRRKDGTIYVVYADTSATPLDTSAGSDFDAQLVSYFQANPTGTFIDPANNQPTNYHVLVLTDGTTPAVKTGLGKDANGKDKAKDLKLIEIAKSLY